MLIFDDDTGAKGAFFDQVGPDDRQIAVDHDAAGSTWASYLFHIRVLAFRRR